MSLLRPRALCGAAALAAAAVIWAGPGAQPAAAYVCSFSIDSPTAGSILAAPEARFTGAFGVQPSPDGRSLEVSFLSSPGPRPASVTRSGGDVGPAGRYDVTVGGLSRNGTYRAQVRATHTGTGLFSCAGGIGSDGRSTSRTAEVTFGVSVRARPPENVRSRFEAGPRRAVVTWARSPDPDTAGYSLSRKVGSGSFQPMGDVPADVLSWTDTALPDGPTTVVYAVTSSRNGPEPNTTSEASEAVTAAPLAVPAASPSDPVVPPGPTAGGSQPPGSTGTGTGTKRKPFTLGRAVAGTSALPAIPKRPAADPRAALLGQGESGGFNPTLPFADQSDQSQEPGEGEEQQQVELIEEGGEQAFVGGSRGPGETRTPAVVFIAAGLLSAVVAAHILWLRAQVLRPTPGAATEALPVEDVTPTAARAGGAATGAARSSRRRGAKRAVLVVRADRGP